MMVVLAGYHSFAAVGNIHHRRHTLSHPIGFQVFNAFELCEAIPNNCDVDWSLVG